MAATEKNAGNYIFIFGCKKGLKSWWIFYYLYMAAKDIFIST